MANTRKQHEKTTFYDYLVKYQMGIGIVGTILFSYFKDQLANKDKEIIDQTWRAKMEILVSNQTDRVTALEHVVYHN